MDVKPSITVLTAKQRDQVHTYAQEILSTVGMRVESASARSLLVSKGCRPVADDRIQIPSETIDWALSAAPSRVDVYTRRGDKAFTLDSEQVTTRFGIGVTNLHYEQPETGRIEAFSKAHMQTAVRLGNTLKQFDLVTTPGIIQDLPPENADLHAALTMAANTVKPLVLLISEASLFIPALDLLETLCGDLAQRPFVIPYFNPITPLVLNAETCDKIMAAIDRGLPFIYNNYGMSGATAPITPGGTLALLTAELLGGLVFTQAVAAGSTVIMGSLPAGFDMRSMMSLMTPHTMLLNLACAEMMAHYGLPHSGTSGSGSGWGPDLLADGGFWLNHLTALMGKVGIAPSVAGNFDSLVFSPTSAVLADEVIRQARQFADGFSLAPESVAVADIGQVGPGGNFLTADLTMKLFRQDPYKSAIWPAMALEQWQAAACPRADDLLHKHAVHVLAQLEVPEDHDDLLAAGQSFIAQTLTR